MNENSEVLVRDRASVVELQPMALDNISSDQEINKELQNPLKKVEKLLDLL